MSSKTLPDPQSKPLHRNGIVRRTADSVMNIKKLFAAAVLTGSNLGHGGILTPSGAFNGQFSEGWESYSHWQPIPLAIMAGHASVFTPPPGGILVAQSGTQYANGNLDFFQASDGLHYVYLAGIAPNQVHYEFQEPVTQFGAYWATWTGAGWPDPAKIQVTFQDSNGSQISIAEFAYSGSSHGVLEWHGWNSSVGIKTIEISSPAFLIMDGLQANVPEVSHEATFAGMGLLTLAMYKSHCGRKRYQDL